MGAQHVVAKNLARPILEQIADGDEIAFALGHLATLELQEAVMHPKARHDRSGERASALSQFILVMRKYQIDAAAMNVERLPQKLPAHGGALDVPPWPPPAPWAVPAWKLRRRGLPQDEIHRIFLVRRNFDPRAGNHLVERAPGEPSIILHLGHIEKYMTLGDISAAIRQEPLHDRDHF